MSYANHRQNPLTLMHSEQPKLHRVLAILSAVGLNEGSVLERKNMIM